MLLHTIARSLLLTTLLGAAGAGAVPITTSLLKPRSATSTNAGVAVDESTGRVYRRDGIGLINSILVYADAAAFAANTPLPTRLTLTGGGLYGTYFEVSDGKIYGRADINTISNGSGTSVSRWDVATGKRELTSAPLTDISGYNTFYWGSSSVVNSGSGLLQDQTGLYAFGRTAMSGRSPFQLNKIDAELNVLSAMTADMGVLGYAFLINGTLFGSTSANKVTRSLNLSTGAVSDVDFTLSNIALNVQWDDASYDYATDTLLLHSSTTGTFQQVSQASVQFGVPVLLPSATTSGGSSSDVPVPATLALVVLGLGLLAGVRRRLR